MGPPKGKAADASPAPGLEGVSPPKGICRRTKLAGAGMGSSWPLSTASSNAIGRWLRLIPRRTSSPLTAFERLRSRRCRAPSRASHQASRLGASWGIHDSWACQLAGAGTWPRPLAWRNSSSGIATAPWGGPSCEPGPWWPKWADSPGPSGPSAPAAGPDSAPPGLARPGISRPNPSAAMANRDWKNWKSSPGPSGAASRSRPPPRRNGGRRGRPSPSRGAPGLAGWSAPEPAREDSC